MPRFFGRHDPARTGEQVETLDNATVVELRSAARLFDLLSRETLFVEDISYARDVLRGLVAQRSAGRLVGVVLSSLAARIEQAYRVKGFDDLAAELGQELHTSGLPCSAGDLEYLGRSIGSTRVHEADGSAVSAVIAAILVRSDGCESSPSLSATLFFAAQAAHNNGLFPLLRRVLAVAGKHSHSLGYRALFNFFRGQMPMTRVKRELYEPIRAQYLSEFAAVERSDPAAPHVRRLARWIQQYDAQDHSGASGDATLATQAARAADRGDHHAVARLYARLVEEAETPDQAAACRLISEFSLLKSGQLINPADFLQSMIRLANDHVTKAKPLLPVDMGLVDFCVAARQADRTHRGSNIAAVAADFAGDVRLGVALDHRYANLSTATRALVDLAAVDALQRDPEVLDIADLKSFLPDVSVVWVAMSHEIVDDPENEPFKSYLHVTTLAATSGSCEVERTTVSPEEIELIELATGASSEEVAESELMWLSGKIFQHLTAENCGAGVYVIPDQPSWELPWARLLPEFVPQFSVAPSIASVMRLTPTVCPRRPRIIGIYNGTLAGAERELEALRRLNADGKVDFLQVHTFENLVSALNSGTYDLLTISAHGTRSEGFEFEIDFGTERVALAEFLSLPLPPTISLGCCWSARSPDSSHSVVASLACILAGASLVIGGLWDLDDRASGALLASTYDGYAEGHSLPVAFRRAFRSQAPDSRAAAAGLCLFGRW